MRFLIDNNLSVYLPRALQDFGHDALHVRELGMGDASDDAILARARADDRFVVSADRDFGSILAKLQDDSPTIIYLRGALPRHPQRLAELLNANLQPHADELAAGYIAVIEPGRMRLRRLPVKDD
jgi:predicted nuclease of predicted toxin-antitoxin system